MQMKLLPCARSPFTFDTNSSVPGESPETTFEKIYIVVQREVISLL